MKCYKSLLNTPRIMEESRGHTRFIGVDALFQYTGSGVQLFSGMVFYIIIVRLFNSTAVGAIALFVAIIGLFNIVFSFGLGTAAQHFTSYNLGKGDHASVRKTIEKIIAYGFMFSILGFVSLLILAPEISIVFLHSDGYIELVRILSVVLVGNVMFGILNGTLLGIQNFRLSALISIIIWVTYYFVSVAFAFYLRSIDTIVFGWVIGIFAGVAIELIAVLTSIRKFLGQGRAPSNGHLMMYSLPILLSGIISVGASSADRFIVSGLISLSSLGVYNFSLLIASSIGFLASPFNNILMPKFSEFLGKGEKDKIAPVVKVSTTLLSYFYVPSALGIAALAPIILNLLGGNQYIGGATPLRIIMFSTAIFISQNILSQAVASIRKTRIFIYSSGLALAANVVFSLVLIPKFGLIGAALGYSSVYGVTFLILYFFARREGIIGFDLYGLAKLWIVSLIMFFTVDYVSDIIGLKISLLPAYILLGAAIYISLGKAIGIFKRESNELILSLFPPYFKKTRWFISSLLLSRERQ